MKTVILKNSAPELYGVLPFFLFADNFQKGIVFSLVFIFTHSSSGVTSILLPKSIEETKRFWISCFASAASASIAASSLRLLDPVLYESCFNQIFFASLSLPVLKMAIAPKNSAETENYIEKIFFGIAYAVAILIFGFAREALAFGIPGFAKLAENRSFLAISAEPAGAFILLGMTAAILKAILKRVFDKTPRENL